MAARKPPSAPRSRARAAPRSLREQLQALPRPRARAALPVPAVVAHAPARFGDLVSDVRRLPQAAAPALSTPPASAPPVAVPAPRRRLWVEERAGMVRARAPDVPARWLDELQAGRIIPRRELDLHRKSAAEARQALTECVREARRARVGAVLVICGRGKHSASDGPVLPEVAVQWLSEALAGEILAFATAPRKWGGQGALIVRLRL